MKIVLIGFMGSGKSVVSTLLSDRIGLPVIDTDALLIDQSDYDSIPEIFTLQGEVVFRELELAAAQSLIGIEKGIIATGGGLVINPLAVQALNQPRATLIYLKTALETVLDRVGDDASRPLLSDRLHLANLYTARCSLYDYYADWVIETDEKSPEEIVGQIATYLLSPISTKRFLQYSPA